QCLNCNLSRIVHSHSLVLSFCAAWSGCIGWFGSFMTFVMKTFLNMTVTAQNANTASRIQDTVALFWKSSMNSTTTMSRAAFIVSRKVQRLSDLLFTGNTSNPCQYNI